MAPSTVLKHQFDEIPDIAEKNIVQAHPFQASCLTLQY